MNIHLRVVIPLVGAVFLVIGLGINQAFHVLATGKIGTTYRIVVQEQTDGGTSYRVECARWYETRFSSTKRFPIANDEDEPAQFFLARTHMYKLYEMQCKTPEVEVITQIP
jgi:hypothetical protein